MRDRSERRIFPRRPFAAAIFTYENGARFAATPVDLSLGGAFLATEAVERINLGDLVSVVFGPEAKVQPPVFLFARVVRRQRGSGKGVGIEWIKAVSTGAAEHLAAFLERTFGIKAAAAERQIEAGEGRFRCLFSFQPILDAGRRHRETMDALLNPLDLGEQPVHRARPSPAGPSPATLAIVPTEAATDARGVITAEMTIGNERAPVDLEATLRVDGVVYEVRLVEIGLSSVEIVTADPVPESPRPVQVAFVVPGRDKPVNVAIEGPITRLRAIQGTRGASLDVAVRLLDEGSTPGVWARFAKWAYFTSLKG